MNLFQNFSRRGRGMQEHVRIHGLQHRSALERDTKWRTCCCHVRTATILYGLWHLSLHVFGFSMIAVVLKNKPDMFGKYISDPKSNSTRITPYFSDPYYINHRGQMEEPRVLPLPDRKVVEMLEIEQFETTSENGSGNILVMDFTATSGASGPFVLPSMNEKPNEKKDVEGSNKDNNIVGFDWLSYLSMRRRTLQYRDVNACIAVTFCTFIITALMVYGAMRGKPLYLLPFFCLQIFDFFIACISVFGCYLSLPSLRVLTRDSPLVDELPESLRDMDTLASVVMLLFALAIIIKAYFINMVWKCYKYLTLRLVRDPYSVPDTEQQSHMDGLLPDYEEVVKDPRYKTKDSMYPPPPPAYSEAVAMEADNSEDKPQQQMA